MSRKLTPKQIKAALMLGSGTTGKHVATSLKIRPETLSRWKRREDFREEMEHVVSGQQQAMRCGLEHFAGTAITAVWSELQPNYSEKIS